MVKLPLTPRLRKGQAERRRHFDCGEQPGYYRGHIYRERWGLGHPDGKRQHDTVQVRGFGAVGPS
jgi:hypothetical protein